ATVTGVQTCALPILYLIHYVGFPGPVQELSVACRARRLLLIEDCAQALLSNCAERPLGSFGDVAIFSIRKTLPVPDGGALVAGTDRKSVGEGEGGDV